MLFSYRVKNEIARIIPKNILAQKDELVAFLILKGSLIKKNQEISLTITLDDSATARTSYNLIKNIFNIHPLVKTKKLPHKKKQYTVEILSVQDCKKIMQEFGLAWKCSYNTKNNLFYEKEITIDELFSKESYLRGAFLISGFVNDPERMYHLEISVDIKTKAEFIHHLLNYFNLNSRISFWKKKWVIYLKKGDSIFEFMRLLGVQNALLYFQDIRARKDILNTVNRLVNCETANLDKTVLSAAKQLRSIDIIEKKIGLKNISPKLALIAKLRRSLPYASLQELTEEINFNITKSGIYHRLKKINQIANEL
jgi:DNA-binding protein WhiA